MAGKGDVTRGSGSSSFGSASVGATNLNNMDSTMNGHNLGPELTYSPVPLIGLFGLNAGQDATHAKVWSGFTSDRSPDRLPMYFNLFSPDHKLKAPKPKKTNYEWHIPKGILKGEWISKHLLNIPSVGVLFFDLDFDDPQWRDREIDCLRSLEQMRMQLNGRFTKIAIVLLQKSVSLPGDMHASERAVHLCEGAQIGDNCLFVLPVTEEPSFINQCFLRMESAFVDLAKGYYTNCIKVVKGHRDHLNKTTHSVLHVRHQFKLAFYSELKQDHGSALKHYKQSYNNLMEVRTSPVNLHEVKCVAGVIIYKMCRLSFMMNHPMDAINYFKKHMDHFRKKMESSDLEFEHHIWVSKQHSMFASCFEESIGAGLIPNGHQNPGYYLYEAAVEAIEWRIMMQSLTINTTSQESARLHQELIVSPSPVIFIGQRSWRQGVLSMDSVDPNRERDSTIALQHQHSLLPHSVITINLLTSAMNHFKKNRCIRLKRWMTVLMAQEYFASTDYTSCLTALNQVMPHYRNEHWHVIVRFLVIEGIKSCFLSGHGQQFIKFCSIFIDEHLFRDEAEEVIIRNNIIQFPNVIMPSAWKVLKSADQIVWHSEVLNPVMDTSMTTSFIESAPGTQAITTTKGDISSKGTGDIQFYIEGSCIKVKSMKDGVDILVQSQPMLSQDAMTKSMMPDVQGDADQPQATPSHPLERGALSSSLNGTSLFLKVDAEIPTTGICRSPILVKFLFTNLIKYDLPIELCVDSNDNFVFSGNKQVRMTIAPSSTWTEMYIMYPFVCGYVNLPKIRLTAYPHFNQAQKLDYLIEAVVPKCIQIMPKGI